jgi:ABC-type lipoprotein export system ATPase subunit
MSDASMDLSSGESSESLLEVKQLEKSYENGHIEALRGVDLSIAAGDFLAITGPSGSGKSTLLQLMGGLDSPTSGEVLFRGQAIGKPMGAAGSMDLDTYRARCVGFIFQAFHLLPSLNALENVQIPMLVGEINRRTREQRRAHCWWRWALSIACASILDNFPRANGSAWRLRAASRTILSCF